MKMSILFLTRALFILFVGVLLATCGAGGAGSGGGRGLFFGGSNSLPGVASIAGADAILLGNSSSLFASTHREIGFFSFSHWRLFSNLAFASSYKKILLISKNKVLSKLLFDGGSYEVSDIRPLGTDYFAIRFMNQGTGILRKSDGKIFDMTEYFGTTKFYGFIHNGYIYIGNKDKNTIYEINLNTFAVRRVNDPGVNPVELSGPNGDFVVAKDINNGNPIVLANMLPGGHCASSGYCMFFYDGTAEALTNDIGYTWPGRSIIYGDDGDIYGWDVSTTITNMNWTQKAYLMKFEFAQTPFVSGFLGRVTSTLIRNVSGSGRPYPTELSARGNNWFDNGDKYFFTAFGYYKVSPVTGAGAAMTFTSMDLSILFENSGATGGGPIPNLTWPDPVTGINNSVWAIFLYKNYLFYKRADTIGRINLANGVVENIYTNAAVYNFTLANNLILAFAPGVTYQIDVNNILGPVTTLGEDISIESSFEF